MVLSTIDISRYNPSIILFEHLHFREQEYQDLISELTQLGYELRRDEMDTIAYKQ